MDSFRGFVFERFVSWIVLCKQKSQITQFVSIRKDSYTNPASLPKGFSTLCSKADFGNIAVHPNDSPLIDLDCRLCVQTKTALT
jgi:hypothetical protein